MRPHDISSAEQKALSRWLLAQEWLNDAALYGSTMLRYAVTSRTKLP